jgi:lysophospholipase L1-like esterase
MQVCAHPRLAILAAVVLLAFARSPVNAQTGAGSNSNGWVASWTAAAHGPYPVGNATAQPELRFAIPSAETGALDQTFRLIVHPDVWGARTRIRLSNAFGDKPVAFDGVTIGLQTSGANILPESICPVTFGGQSSITIGPGQTMVSDGVKLPFAEHPDDPMLTDRKLAVSLHVAGDSGRLTWHAKALTTSYLTASGAGAHGQDVGEAAFPYSTTSWFFLDEVDMQASARVIVAFGDSITDGTASTLNGDDRWPDVFSRRLRREYGSRFAVVNEGIGGNRVVGPDDYGQHPFAGGPAAGERLQRDLISLPGVSAVIWLEGINDFHIGGETPEVVIAGVRRSVEQLRAAIPGVRIFMGTLTPALHSQLDIAGTAEVDAKRQAYNRFIRSAGIFDGVIDFESATLDPVSGELKAEFQPNSSTGGPGDKLHPNRAGYAAMARAIDLRAVIGE